MKDILLDDANDLLFEAGDFVINDSDNQHVYLVVKSSFCFVFQTLVQLQRFQAGQKHCLALRH